jgi:S-adenosylmethionine synthetase
LLGRDVVKAFERKQWTVIGTALTRVNPPHTIKLDLLDKSNIVSALDEAK